MHPGRDITRPLYPISNHGSPVNLLKFQMAPNLKLLISPGSKKKEPAQIRVSEWGQNLALTQNVGLGFPLTQHLLHNGLSSSPSRWRCLLRVLWPLRRPVTALDWVLLKVRNLALVPRPCPEINSLACLWMSPRPRHAAHCWLINQQPSLFCMSRSETPRAGSGPRNLRAEPLLANSSSAISLPLTPRNDNLITNFYCSCSPSRSVQRLSTLNCVSELRGRLWKRQVFFLSTVRSVKVTMWRSGFGRKLQLNGKGKRTTVSRYYQLICAMSHAVLQTLPLEGKLWTVLYSVWEIVSLWIYFLTAIGLTLGRSRTVHIYTQTVHRTAELIWKECGPCSDFEGYTLSFALQLRKKHRKTSVRVAEGCQLAWWKQNIHIEHT